MPSSWVDPAVFWSPIAIRFGCCRNDDNEQWESIAKEAQVQSFDLASVEVICNVQVSDCEEEHQSLNKHPWERGQEEILKEPSDDGTPNPIACPVHSSEQQKLCQEEADTELQMHGSARVTAGTAEEEGEDSEAEAQQRECEPNIGEDQQRKIILSMDVLKSHDYGKGW